MCKLTFFKYLFLRCMLNAVFPIFCCYLYVFVKPLKESTCDPFSIFPEENVYSEEFINKNGETTSGYSNLLS